jgi:predicted enzyme related to lactoylglutathione lyase
MSTPPAWIDITAKDAERSRAFYRDLPACVVCFEVRSL